MYANFLRAQECHRLTGSWYFSRLKELDDRTIGYGVETTRGCGVTARRHREDHNFAVGDQQFGQDVSVYISILITAAEFLEQSSGFQLGLQVVSNRHVEGYRPVSSCATRGLAPCSSSTNPGLPSALLEETRLLLNFETNSENCAG